MVSKTNRGRRTSLKRRYTKRKVHRNKYARKSYRTKRGGAVGTLHDCELECNKYKYNNPNRYRECMENCITLMTNAAPPGHPLYQEKVEPSIKFEYPDVKLI